MVTVEEQIVKAVLTTFDALPKKCKPRELDERGVAEWVPLCGIATYDEGLGTVRCEALGTGMKCLPLSKVSTANGNILHDWHAEIVAIRAFNSFLLGEAFRLLSNPSGESHILTWRTEAEKSTPGHQQPFTINPELRLLVYCSEAPCGDASMELVMEKQADATPWPVDDIGEDETGLLGREGFSQLGVVRRKPARRDSPITLSKSCSDKLALKQCTSLLSSLTTAIVAPDNAYIDTIILPRGQYLPQAWERAFGASGRMSPVVGNDWKNRHAFRPFKVATTDTEFPFSQSAIRRRSLTSKASNISAHWTPCISETTINGVLQGRKQDDPEGACALSRRRMFQLFHGCASDAYPSLFSAWRSHSYQVVKRSVAEMTERAQVKDHVIGTALKGWTKNASDDFPSDFEPSDSLENDHLPR